MTIIDIQKDFETRFKDMLDLVEVQAGVSERENFKSSIRTSIEKAFEETKIEDKELIQYFDNYSDSGNFDNTYKEGHICGEVFGYKNAIDELKSNQAKFLNGEKNEK